MQPETLERVLQEFEANGDFQPVRKILRKLETRRQAANNDPQTNAQAIALCLRIGEEGQDVVLLNTTLKLLDILPLSNDDKYDITGKAMAALDRLKLE